MQTVVDEAFGDQLLYQLTNLSNHLMLMRVVDYTNKWN